MSAANLWDIESKRKDFWRIKLNDLAKKLEKNRFAVSVAEDAAQAAKILMDQILPPLEAKNFSNGGSVTVASNLEIIETLKDKGLEHIDIFSPHPLGDQATEADLIEHTQKMLTTDLYLSSSNAVTEKGQLVNLDCVGNRVGAIHFGPKKVVLFIGRNKITPNVEDAMAHIRSFTAVLNNFRLKEFLKNPCQEIGRCIDCNSPDRICNQWVITEKCYTEKRIHIILINEDLGM